MQNTVLVCKDFVSDFPDVHRALCERFDIEVFDLVHLDQVIDRLSGRTISVAIMRFECLEVFLPIASILGPTGTRVDHYLTYRADSTPVSEAELSAMGLCAHLEVSRGPDAAVAAVESLRTHCPGHPDTPPTTAFANGSNVHGNSILDSNIIRFVSLGLSDREIAELLHYSSQTIRNRVSRILKENGFENRTNLAIAQFRDALSSAASSSIMKTSGT